MKNEAETITERRDSETQVVKIIYVNNWILSLPPKRYENVSKFNVLCFRWVEVDQSSRPETFHRLHIQASSNFCHLLFSFPV